MADACSAGVEVDIFGKRYTFACKSPQDAERIRQVARVVDQSMQGARCGAGAHSALQRAVLAGLDLVDELFELQRDYQQVEAHIARRASSLTDSLGRLLQESGIDSAGRS